MLTFIIVLVLAAAIATFFLIKKGKIADVNNNNIPDVVETKVGTVVAEIKEEIKKAKKTATKKSVAKTNAKKAVKKSK